TDTESEPFKGEAEIPISPHIIAPLTCHVEESEGSDTFGVRSTSSDSTAPLSLDHPLTHTTPTLVPILRRTARMAMRVQSAMSPGLSAGIAEVAAMFDSAFRKRFRSFYDSSPSPTLLVRKRYRDTFEIILDTDSEEDEKVHESLDSDSVSEDAEVEGPTTEDGDPAAGDEGLAAGDEGPGEEEEEEAVPEGQQHAASVVGTVVSVHLGLGYGVLRRRELALGEDHVYSTFEVSQGSGSALEPERSKRVSASRQPTLTTWTDPKDGMIYIDVPAYLPPVPPAQTPPSPEWSSGLFPISPAPSIVPSPISSPMISLIIPSPIASPAAPVIEMAMGEPPRLGYGALGRQEIALGEGRMPSVFEEDLEGGLTYIDAPAFPPPAPPVQTPPSPEWSSGSLFVSPAPSIVSSPISSPMISLIVPSPTASPATTEAEGFLTKLGGQIVEERRARLDLAEIVDSMRRGQDNCVYSLDGYAMAGELNACVEEKDSLAQSELYKTFWAEATCTTAYLINRSSSTMTEKKTPMKMRSGHPSDYEMLRIFGCVAYSHVRQGKLEPRAVKCVLLGYPAGVKGYILYRLNDESSKIITSRNVVFNESVMYKDTLKDSSAGADKSVEELQINLCGSLEVVKVVFLEMSEESLLLSDISVKVELQGLNNGMLEEDQTNQKDDNDEDAEKMDSLRKNKTWELVDHPAGQKLVSCKWLFNIKEGIEGVQKPRYKVRLLARGFTQRADNMLIACKSIDEIETTKSSLKKEFDMKELGEAKKILGMEINRQWEIGSDVIGEHFKLSLKDCPVTDSDLERMNHGNHVDVIGFVDLDYDKDPDKGRSITGYIFLVQGCVAVTEAIWLKELLEELGMKLNTVVVNCDNQDEIHLSRNHVFHERTKHINLRYHFIREVLEAKTVEVLKVGTKYNVVDALTKVVPRLKLQHCLELLSVGVG
nr:retrovirus-related Pol polyprotein from transposon TNT 1-94 [Tanacetum cinerariifolium]